VQTAHNCIQVSALVMHACSTQATCTRAVYSHAAERVLLHACTLHISCTLATGYRIVGMRFGLF